MPCALPQVLEVDFSFLNWRRGHMAGKQVWRKGQGKIQ